MFQQRGFNMRLFRLMWGLALLISLEGCQSSSFFGGRFDDFTAYYNRFYNAQEAFRQGIKGIERSNQDINRDEYMPLFVGRENAGAGSFEKVIKKSADMLRAHPKSKWADDAILLIGKSYFYQGEFIGAEQKFSEIIRSSGTLEDEARFWMARTLISSKSYDRASEFLKESIALPDVKTKWRARMQLALGELFVRQKQWAQAAQNLDEGLRQISDPELAAKGHFLLGQVYETLGDFPKAARAYHAVPSYKPAYELIFAALINEAEVNGLHIRPDLGLNIIRRLVRDDKYVKERGQIRLLEARILARQNKVQQAYGIFDDLLYNPQSNGASVKGKVHYALGQMFRDQLRNYRRAGAHFDTAATNLRINPMEETKLLTPQAITNAGALSATFKSLNAANGRIQVIDSLLWVAGLKRATFDSLINVARVQQERIQRARQEEAERRQAEQRFNSNQQQRVSNSGSFGGRYGDNQPGGFLGHQDPIRVQEGKNTFKQRWGDRPLAPNWRRKAAIGAVSVSSSRADSLRNANRGGNSTTSRGGDVVIDTTAVPRTLVARQKLVNERAALRYDLGNILFLQMSLPDSASVWYRKVIEEEKDQPISQRAYFALAEVQLAVQDSLTAKRLYEYIVSTYPESDFATRARERLGIAAIKSSMNDSLALAEQTYQQAYRYWEADQYQLALTELLRLASDYPSPKIAPRALLAAGQVYSAWAKTGEVPLFEPWPAAVHPPEMPTDSVKTTIKHLPEPLTLENVYAMVADKFATSPYGKQAGLLKNALKDFKPKPPQPETKPATETPAAGETGTVTTTENPPATPPANGIPLPTGQPTSGNPSPQGTVPPVAPPGTPPPKVNPRKDDQ